MKRNLGILVILIVIVFAGILLSRNNQTTPKQMSATPSISLALTNTISSTVTISSSPIVTTAEKSISFQSPKDLSTKYIDPHIWPPQITATSGKFICNEGGLSINGRPDMTIRKTIGDRVYCIKSVSEGAAGSIYTTYTYSTTKNGRLLTLYFILRYPECGNFNNPQKTECENERQTFDLDSLIDHIVQTVIFK